MPICPRLEIDLGKIKHNTKVLVDKLKEENIEIAGVTKVFCALPKVAGVLVEGGVKYLADSRIENLIKLKDIEVEKWLLRLPMQSQVAEVVKYADISLNSELETIKRLSDEALKVNKIHGIILMIDLGDLREGIWQDKAVEIAEEVIKLNGVKLIGVGTNLTCYGGVIPSKDNLGKLVEIAEKIERSFNIELEIISGGNSSSLDLLERRQMPEKINNLRLGESILLGRETAYGNSIKDTYQDAFQLVAEIVELKEKPSVPIGEIGMDAFGNKPVFEDKGIRKRAILAVGRQDVNPESIIPVDEKISIFGASSDHLIIDVTDSKKDYNVGDEVRFNLEYGSLLGLATSEYIYKKIL
ncbi:ornithine racemase Orr [Paramaledivibacter caminithermalis]|uniref:Predicted amino acid racemase n=1 Tax=Paramaledivibacter caminithermalis (strain DSM 15212 / CIP 107654 / DViRD3) TaxID=1121301 RepID=A0A1M6JVL5_PARC5|nr:ornithine racemase Orr [Paramaledivibacter caminithermalis]SHJ50710.1 Predicted amino acid racemase [Paramaledivibacter caminithermalis DSM 15212]